MAMWMDSYFNVGMTHFCKKNKKLEDLKNDLLFAQVLTKNIDIALGCRYKILNLPDTVSERVVMESLLVYGNVVFFKDKNMDCILALPGVMAQGGLNLYGDPVGMYVFSKNGLADFNREVKLYKKGDNKILYEGSGNSNIEEPDAVCIWENRSRYPFFQTVLYFSEAIADTYRTIDVAKTYIKNPFICVAEESAVPSVRKMLEEFRNNKEFIIASTGIQSIDKFNILDITTAPESINTAATLVDWYESKFLDACSMKSNQNVDKKGENLISDEVNILDDKVSKTTNNILDYIQEQLDIANEFLGTNMKVVEVEGEEQTQEVQGDENENTEDAD